MAFGFCGVRVVNAAVLTVTFTPIPQGEVVNLTAEGPLDWVHWGLFTESTLNRKAGVTPLLPDFIPIPNAFNGPYQYADNFNGYSWSDGTPRPGVTNTPTGVWMYGKSRGFQLDFPVGTSTNIVKVYVGTFAAVGKFQAALGGTSLSYTDTSIRNMSNGPGGFYTLTCLADSPAQTLTVKFTVDQVFDNTGNVTLQAAALSAPGANNPPAVSIVSPADGDKIPAHADLTIAAAAADTDGTVVEVEFFQEGTALGESTVSPFAHTWSNVPAGKYSLTARATDDRGASGNSPPVKVYVNGGGGALSGTVALPPGGVDLSAEGVLDWAHWGLTSASSFNHKAGVAQKISDLTKIGTGDTQQLQDNFTAFSWSDGTPSASASGTRSGVFVHGVGDGFRITAPADTNPRTLKVYVGLYGSEGSFDAYLSDFSAPAYTDTSLKSVFGNDYAVYSLEYSAASPGQTLVVEYTVKNLFDENYGNITFQAATLSGSAVSSNSPPTVMITSPVTNATFPAGANIPIEVSATDSDGAVAQVQFFEGTNPLGAASASPFGFTWMNVPAGNYSLTAKATDNGGATATSTAVDITVTGQVNLPPTVVITAPTNNSEFVEPATFTILATASDSDGSIRQVEFFDGPNSLGSATSAPYSLGWNNVTAGSHSLSAVATDNDGASAASAPVNIIVRSSTVNPFTLITATAGTNPFKFSFATESGRTYVVEQTLSLNPIDWQTLTTALGDGSVVTVPVATAEQTQQFYRVKTQ